MLCGRSGSPTSSAGSNIAATATSKSEQLSPRREVRASGSQIVIEPELYRRRPRVRGLNHFDQLRLVSPEHIRSEADPVIECHGDRGIDLLAARLPDCRTQVPH